jgi:hypothetical protein
VAPQCLKAQSKEVIAIKGDGIYKLLKRNGIDPAKYTDSFIELNKTRLGKDNALFAGVKYKLPDTGNSAIETIAAVTDSPAPAVPSKISAQMKHFDMFGSKYAKVAAALPLAAAFAITGLEFLVAFLQAYVFAILTVIYLNDVVHMHH